MYYLDTNIFIRAITGDDEEKQTKCQSLLRKINNRKISAMTSESVILEVVFVLSSKEAGYKYSKKDIQEALSALLRISSLKLQNKKVFLVALDIYAKYALDFADAVAAAFQLTHKLAGVYSYDTDIDKVAGVTRLQP